MKNKNLIWLGLGAVALYLYFRNKPKTSVVTQNVAPSSMVATTTKIPPMNTPRPIPENVPAREKRYMPIDPIEKIDCNWVKNQILELEKTKIPISAQNRYANIKLESAARNCGMKMPSYLVY